MSEAKQADQWNHTAAIRLDLWRIATGFSGKKVNLEFQQFHPMLKSNGTKRRLSREESHDLLKEFVNGSQREGTTIRQGGHRT